MEQLGVIDLLLICILFALQVWSIWCHLKINRSNNIFIGYTSMMRFIFVYCLCRGLHFLLLFGLEYTTDVIGLAPLYNYREIYMFVLDDLSNIILFLTFLQFTSILMHSLNVHPAIIVIQEKIDIRVLFITNFIVVSCYVLVTLICFSYSLFSVYVLSFMNLVFFVCLEVFIEIQFIRYAKQVSELFQQTLLSNELKHKQLRSVLARLSIPFCCIILRIAFRLIVYCFPFVELKSLLMMTIFVLVTEVFPLVSITILLSISVNHSQQHHEFFEQIVSSLQSIVAV